MKIGEEGIKRDIARRVLRDQIVLGNFPPRVPNHDAVVSETNAADFLNALPEFTALLKREIGEGHQLKVSRNITADVIEKLTLEGLLVKGVKQSAVVKVWSAEETLQLLRLRYSQASLIFCTLADTRARWQQDVVDGLFDVVRGFDRGEVADQFQGAAPLTASLSEHNRAIEEWRAEASQKRLDWTKAIVTLYSTLAEMANLKVLVPQLYAPHVFVGGARFDETRRALRPNEIAHKVAITNMELSSVIRGVGDVRAAKNEEKEAARHYLVCLIRWVHYRNALRWHAGTINAQDVIFDSPRVAYDQFWNPFETDGNNILMFPMASAYPRVQVRMDDIDFSKIDDNLMAY